MQNIKSEELILKTFLNCSRIYSWWTEVELNQIINKMKMTETGIRKEIYSQNPLSFSLFIHYSTPEQFLLGTLEMSKTWYFVIFAFVLKWDKNIDNTVLTSCIAHAIKSQWKCIKFINILWTCSKRNLQKSDACKRRTLFHTRKSVAY